MVDSTSKRQASFQVFRGPLSTTVIVRSVPGATVKLGPRQATTGLDGVARFELAKAVIPAGGSEVSRARKSRE